MPASASRRLNRQWYRRLPCSPTPEALAQQLVEAKVAGKAAKRIDSYERFHHQHSEHRKALTRGVLGAVGLVLSVAPSFPSLVTSCRREEGFSYECGVRLSAMIGATLALGVTFWAFADLYNQPSMLGVHVAKLNEEIGRAIMARNGQASVTRLFDLYRSMSKEEQGVLKKFLHDKAQEPNNPAARRQLRRNETSLRMREDGIDDDAAGWPDVATETDDEDRASCAHSFG